METNKERFLRLLKLTNRQGMDKLIEFLEVSGFFLAPASSKFHLNKEGGLLKHSLNLHDTLKKLLEDHAPSIIFPVDSVIICSLLHDVCKARLYKKISGEFVYDKAEGDKGHGTYSVKILEAFIALTPLEQSCIKHHMGWYSKDIPSINITFEFEDKRLKLFYFADDITAQFTDSREIGG